MNNRKSSSSPWTGVIVVFVVVTLAVVAVVVCQHFNWFRDTDGAQTTQQTEQSNGQKSNSETNDGEHHEGKKEGADNTSSGSTKVTAPDDKNPPQLKKKKGQPDYESYIQEVLKYYLSRTEKRLNNKIIEIGSQSTNNLKTIENNIKQGVSKVGDKVDAKVGELDKNLDGKLKERDQRYQNMLLVAGGSLALLLIVLIVWVIVLSGKIKNKQVAEGSIRKTLEEFGKKTETLDEKPDGLDGLKEGTERAAEPEPGEPLKSSVQSPVVDLPDLSSVKEVLQWLKNNLPSIKVSIDEKIDEIKDLKLKVDDAATNNAQTAQNLVDKAGEIRATADGIKTQADEILKNIERRIDEVRAKVRDQYEKDIIPDLQNKNAALAAKVEKADSTGYERGKNEVEQKYKPIKEKLADLELAYENACKGLESVPLQIAKAVGEKETELTADFQKQLGEKNKLISGLQERKKAACEELSKQLNDKSNDLETAKQKLNDTGKKLADAKKLLEDKDNELIKNQENIALLQNAKSDLEKTVNKQVETINGLTEQKSELDRELKEADNRITELRKSIYPAEFISDPDAAPLREHLDQWFGEKIATAEIVRAALALFCQREHLNQSTWEQALRNISLGITQTLEAKGATPSDVLTELVLWSKFLMKFSDEEHDFSLKLPDIGDDVNPSWMTVVKGRAARVGKIRTWAVWNNQFGVRHNAEVE